MSICEKRLPFNNRAMLAPMSGVTDPAFRRAAKSLGLEITTSEMTASRAILTGEPDECRKLNDIDDQTIVQIAGHEPEAMAEAARICEGRGAIMVDVNFGCPAKKIVNKYAGSALMRDELLATKILEKVANAVSIPVSVKMRTGWDNESRNAEIIAQIAENSGYTIITVHGRTRAQKFSGTADWRFIRRVRNAVKIPVIANGDVTSLKSARECLRQSGAAGVMIGRAVIGRPWVLAEINQGLSNNSLDNPNTSLQTKLKIIRSHYTDIVCSYQNRRGVLIARKHLAAYLKELPKGTAELGEILRFEDPDSVLQRIDQYAEKWEPAA